MGRLWLATSTVTVRPMLHAQECVVGPRFRLPSGVVMASSASPTTACITSPSGRPVVVSRWSQLTSTVVASFSQANLVETRGLTLLLWEDVAGPRCPLPLLSKRAHSECGGPQAEFR